jgi:hypothetical protein
VESWLTLNESTHCASFNPPATLDPIMPLRHRGLLAMLDRMLVNY